MEWNGSLPQRRPGASLSRRGPDLVLPSGSAATLHGSSGNRRLFCLESGGGRSWCEPLQGEKLSFHQACLIWVPSWAPSEHEAALVIGAPAWYPESWGLHTAAVSGLASHQSGLELTPPSCWLFSFFCYQSLIQAFCYLSHVISHWTERFPLTV